MRLSISVMRCISVKKIYKNIKVKALVNKYMQLQFKQ